jgi:hypothetical protein
MKLVFFVIQIPQICFGVLNESNDTASAKDLAEVDVTTAAFIFT